MTPLIVCALLGASPDFVPPGGGDMARALPFVTAAVGEDMWTAYRGPEHRGNYRVVSSAYSRDANGLDLVVYWQVHNPLGDKKRDIGAVDPRVREGTMAPITSGSTEPLVPGLLQAGEASAVQRSRYRLPAQTRPENLWWDVGNDPEVVRVHLRPHLSTPKKALLPPAAPWSSQRADAHSTAVPKLSILKASEDGRGCDWFVQDAPNKPPRRLGTSNQGCNLTYVALRPDGKKALLNAMRPEEIDLQTGAHTSVRLPALAGAKGFAGYSDRGDLSAIFGKTTLVDNMISDPVLYTRFNSRGSKWAQADTMAVHYPICDTFMARHSPMAQDMTCQYLHVATAYTSPCHPLSMPRDACNNPPWMPPSDTLLALLDPCPPQPSARAWVHQKRWVVLDTPWASVAATIQTQVSTTPTLDQPVWLVKDDELVPLEDFAGVGPVYVAIRGPYLLLGRSEARHRGPHHFLGQQGSDRVFRLYDLRDGRVIDTFAPGYNSVAFWPAGQ